MKTVYTTLLYISFLCIGAYCEIPDGDTGADTEDVELKKVIDEYEENAPTNGETNQNIEIDENINNNNEQLSQDEIEKNQEAEDLYEKGMEIINSSRLFDELSIGYQYLEQSSNLGHKKASVEVAFVKLFGHYLPQNITYAKSVFEENAVNGLPKAQTGLAFLFGTGIHTNSSQARSLIHMTFAALGDDVMGKMMLAYRHFAGISVQQNCESALIYYHKVADIVAKGASITGGPIVHRIRLIDEVENPVGSGNVVDDDLIQYYKFLADKGDVQAQVGLAQLSYQGGRGFEQNEQQAFDYFKMAADAGNANAQAYLGKMYSTGSKIVKQDNKTALELFEKSALQGNPVGQAGLAHMYLEGKGVDVDYKKAFKYFQLSADQGWVEGQLNLGNMFFHGKGVTRDYKQALRYYNLASQSGNLHAFHYLAEMQARGVGVARSCHLAVELYKNVCERGKWAVLFENAYQQYKKGNIDAALVIYSFLAELGYEVAQSNVAYLLDDKESNLLKQQTMPRAMLYWSRAASQGNTIARVKLGDYHYYGYGTTIDYETAAMHYKLAYEQSNNPQAMFNLGYMHEQGLGMKKDIHLAKRFYDLAAEASPDAQAPVTLALLKIGILFAIDFIKEQKWLEYLNFNWQGYISDDWDIYLMTFLALVLGFILAFRRQQQQMAPQR